MSRLPSCAAVPWQEERCSMTAFAHCLAFARWCITTCPAARIAAKRSSSWRPALACVGRASRSQQALKEAEESEGGDGGGERKALARRPALGATRSPRFAASSAAKPFGGAEDADAAPTSAGRGLPLDRSITFSFIITGPLAGEPLAASLSLRATPHLSFSLPSPCHCIARRRITSGFAACRLSAKSPKSSFFAAVRAILPRAAACSLVAALFFTTATRLSLPRPAFCNAIAAT